ncbi:MAG: DMT family transporter [Burkholderiales bacterium]|nr:DMT family transporter [Burkholderiales bacterium]
MIRRADLASLAALGAIWGSSYLFIRIIVPVLGPWGMVAPRMLGAGLMLLLVARLTGVPFGESAPWRRYVVLAFLTSFAAQYLIASAAYTLNSPTLAIINSTMAMFVALFSAWLLHERLPAKGIAGLVLGVAGVALVVGFTPMAMTPAVAAAYTCAVVAAACGAFGTVYAARHLRQRSSLELAAAQSLLAGAMALPLGVAPIAAAWPIPGTVVAALVALSVVCTALANLIYYRLMKRTSPTVSMSVTYLIPCFSLLWGWLFLDETVTLPQLAGFAVVLAAVGLVAARAR